MKDFRVRNHLWIRCQRFGQTLYLGMLLLRTGIFSKLPDDNEKPPKTGPNRSVDPHWSDQDVTLATVTAITHRVTRMMGAETAEERLPHPLITDANLDRYLGRAAEAQQAVSATNSRHGVGMLLPAANAQTELDDALIHCLHQLDHRTQQQDQRIIELEAKLADTTKRLCSLESERSLMGR